ncbi:MAG: peptidoglycan-binding protein [Firmicutes bacterium]|nr:peptidoglycan-binding protein [Bacillota bacterium]
MTFDYPAAIPYIPEYIRVHLGAPGSNSTIITVPFVEYIKNAASSELYPSWPESALRANIYAIVSFTLNRVFTEWYPSRGYEFDITNTTQYDQAFVNGRNYFDNISRIVDEIFNDYLREPGQIAPYFAQYCDGRQTTCEGLSQWGSVELAEQGMGPYDILRYYYGIDLEIVENAPIININESYPGTPIRPGDEGFYVRSVQILLNRIRTTYSAIPPIPEENGIFDEYTEAAVRAYQSIFNLAVDGIVGKATWYSMVRIFTSLRKLSELNSMGLDFNYLYNDFEYSLSTGDTGFFVELIQYFINYIANFNEYVLPIEMTGTYDQYTEQAVRSFQSFAGLPVTGIADEATTVELYNAYIGTSERGV